MDEQGAMLLEFAIVLPLLFFCVWGVLVFCLQVIESQMLHFAAYTAAHVALFGTEEAATKGAAGFLATSRKEPIWLSASLRQLTGRELSVSKNRQRVEIQVARKPDLLANASAWLGTKMSLFPDQTVFYAMGRSQR